MRECGTARGPGPRARESIAAEIGGRLGKRGNRRLLSGHTADH